MWSRLSKKAGGDKEIYGEEVMLSVIVPVYNEEATVGLVLSKLTRLEFIREVIVVDDGSTDRTYEVISEMEGGKIVSVRIDRNRGKAEAVKRGLSLVSSEAEVIAIQDADLEYPPENLLRLYDAYLVTDADMVVGVRTMTWDEITGISLGSFVANKLIAYLMGCPDVFSGQRLIKKSFIEEVGLSSKGFEIETELTMRAILGGYRVVWERVDYKPRSRAEGKKIGALDFLRIMRTYWSSKLSKGKAWGYGHS